MQTQQSPPPRAEADEADRAMEQLMRFVGVLRRRWLVVAVTVVVAVAGSFAAISMLRPKWRASATVVLQQSIRATIMKHEPRLRSVAVTPVQSQDPLALAFEIFGRLASGAHRGPFRVRTELTSTGKMQVSGR